MRPMVCRKITGFALVWFVLFSTACEIDTEVAVPNDNEPLTQDTEIPMEQGMNGPLASSCDVKGYQDINGSLYSIVSYRSYSDGRVAVTTGVEDCQVMTFDADGELESNVTTPFWIIDLIVLDDGKLIGMYEEDTSLVIAKMDDDVMEWSIHLPRELEYRHSLETIAMTLDGEDLLIAFAFIGSVTLGPGETNETVLGTPGSADLSMFLARYNADSGELISASALFGDDAFFPNEITVGPDGQIYIAGTSSVAVGENWCVVTALFDEDGNKEWVNHMSCYSFRDVPPGMRNTEILPIENGGFYLRGEFFVKAIIYDRFGEHVTLEAPVFYGELYTVSSPTHYIAHFNNNGKLLWAKNDVADSEDEYYSHVTTATLLEDKLLVGGRVVGAVRLDRGRPGEVIIGYHDPNLPEFDPAADPLSQSSPAEHPFIALYNTKGDLEWARVFEQQFLLQDITVTADGETRVAGTFDTPVDFGVEGEAVTLEPGTDPDLGVGLLFVDLCSD